MRTQVMDPVAVGTPYIEYFSVDDATPQRVALDSLPFTIGRDETADLALDSHRVSREHAVIVGQSPSFTVRDLSSTNGTFVNGTRVDEAALNNGDLLVIADAELTFYFQETAESKTTATLVLAETDEPTEAPSAGGWLITREVRRLQQLLHTTAFECRFQPILDLESEAQAAFSVCESAGGDDDPAPLLPPFLEDVTSHLTSRLHEAFRSRALLEIRPLLNKRRLFVDLYSAELASHSLLPSLVHLATLLPRASQLVVCIPENVTADAAVLADLNNGLADVAICVACSSIGSDSGDHPSAWETCPDYLKLDAALIRGALRTKKRQKQIQSVTRTCREAGIDVIADGIRTDAEDRLCRSLGCRFGQGPWYGSPQPIGRLQGNRAQ